MGKLRTYKLLKEDLICESYLNEININSYRKIMTKLRGGLLELRANTGRYENLAYEERICLVCNAAVENEFHFLLECCQYNSIRENCIPNYYFTYPTNVKFKQLFTNTTPVVLLKVCKFVVAALKQRDLLLSVT